MPELEWKPVQDFEGLYEVSNTGLVRSLDREINHSRSGNTFTKKGQLLKQAKDKDGYCLISLSRNSKQKKVRVHRLVGQSFISNPTNLPLINHLDGDKTNNVVTNLEWANHSMNATHAINLGLTKFLGEDNPSSKLTEQDVLNIRHMNSMGYSSEHLQFLFKVSSNTIYQICTRKSWRHL